MTMLNITVPPLPIKQRVLIDDDEYVTARNALTIFCFVVAFIGIITNTLNMKTFISMGLDAGVTVSFLTLSVSDLGVSVSAFILGVSSICTWVEVKAGVTFYVQPFAVTMFAGNLFLMFYVMTGLTTTYLAVARCMCVAKPLQFKNTFSSSRAIVVFVVVAFLALGSYVPILTQMGTHVAFDKSVNRTRVVLWLNAVREDMKDVASFVFNIFLFIITTVVITICIIVMADCLRKSGEFRQSASTSTTSTSMSTTGNDDNKKSFKLSGKELKVVQQVVVISTIYLVCALPKLVFLYSFMEPQFGVSERLRNFYFVISYVHTAAGIVNSSCTFPIYYAYNSKFRSLCTLRWTSTGPVF